MRSGRVIATHVLILKEGFAEDYGPDEYGRRSFKPKKPEKPWMMELRLPTGRSVTATVDLSDMEALAECFSAPRPGRVG
jgi:hypothetical protein